MNLTRRAWLKGLGLLGLGSTMGGLERALAATGGPGSPLLIHCTFDGGWDQLMALDPRDATQYGPESVIHPAYDLLADADTQAMLAATGGTGIIRPAGSAIAFGPAMGALTQHYGRLCVIRGMTMETVTHDVGRRYFLTGKFPQGLAANGSALGTVVAAAVGDERPVPNLVVAGESYNAGLPLFASGLSVRRSADLLSVLSRLGAPLPDASQQAVDAWHTAEKCSDRLYDGEGAVTAWADARDRAAVLASGQLGSHFQFTKAPSAEIQALYSAFGVDTSSNQALTGDLGGAKGFAMIAAQAITQGVAQCVSIPLVSSLIDDHDDNWTTGHAPALRAGFDALASLVKVLETTKDESGVAYIERTLILVTSDFARTPRLNARGGRDHHLASSCLLLGRGIAGNRVIGATRDDNFGEQPVDPETGLVAEGGVLVRPADVHATLLTALGLGTDSVSNQNPTVLQAALA